MVFSCQPCFCGAEACHLSRCVLMCVALQALSSISAFCLMAHEGLSQGADAVMEQWRKDFGPRAHVLLGKPLVHSGCSLCL